jgi:hypothetical protein
MRKIDSKAMNSPMLWGKKGGEGRGVSHTPSMGSPRKKAERIHESQQICRVGRTMEKNRGNEERGGRKGGAGKRKSREEKVVGEVAKRP